MTHDMLTEPSLSPHPRKGREGKGIGNEGKIQDQVSSLTLDAARSLRIGFGAKR